MLANGVCRTAVVHLKCIGLQNVTGMKHLVRRL